MDIRVTRILIRAPKAAHGLRLLLFVRRHTHMPEMTGRFRVTDGST
jgi:hypothetical protein